MTEPSPDERPPLSSGTRLTIRVLAIVAVVLLAASTALAIVLKSHRDDRNALRDSRDGAVVAARQAIVNLDALSAATIDADLKRVLDGATGTFKDQFSHSQADLKSLIVARKTQSSGTILSAGAVRADASTATVLVAVDRLVKDSTNTSGAVAHDRWRVDLEKHGGRWLVADLQPVS